MSNNTNIASVISPDILKTISSSTAIKTFNDQLKNKAKETVIAFAKNKTDEIKGKIDEVTKQIIQAGTDHNTEVSRLNTLYQNRQITQENYSKALEAESIAYQTQLNDLQNQKQKFLDDLNKIIADPYKKIKDNITTRKNQLKLLKAKNKANRVRSKQDLNKKVFLNTVKNLAPVLALQLANSLVSIISQRGKLEVLVNQVNAYIDTAHTADTVKIATDLRNNAITLINNSINKLNKLKKTVEGISKIITILIIVITAIEVILSLPIPALLALKVILQPKLQRILKLIGSLSVILVIATTILENEIIKLNELIAKLKYASLKLDANSLTDLNQQELNDIITSISSNNNNNQFPEYKGFKFKIKEEQNIAFVVKGNKRHYAVAIDRDGVEVLKSEYSFTLDPNDLVDQLKLVIDQRNLQG